MDFIENPRRHPRARLRCPARVATREGRCWLTFTRDFAAAGCQIEAPAPVEPGVRVFVQLLDDARARTGLGVTGRIAWCTSGPPWSAGVEFDAGCAGATERFLATLAAGSPRISATLHAPLRLPRAALLAPAPPPVAIPPSLNPEEARVLRALGAGRSVGALVAELGADASHQALFALLARRYVAIGSPDRRAAERWVPVLDGLTARDSRPAGDRPTP
jgi:hypothetical protein